MKEYLKWIIVGGAFIIPFLSFYVANDMFFPFIVGKNFGFRILVEIMFGAWLILAYMDAQYRPKRSYLLMAIAALVAIIGVADLFGVNPYKSFWSNYERMDGYITTLHLFGYFLAVASVFKTKKIWNRLFNVMIIASVLLALRGIGEVISGDYTGARLATTLGNAIYLAVYMLFHMFITLYMLFRDKVSDWTIRHYLYIAAVVLQFLNLYFTATRGTLLGLVGGVLLTALIIAVFERKNKGLRMVAAGLVGAVVLFVAGFIAMKDSDLIQQSPVLNRFANISINAGSGSDRFMIWGIAYEGFKERPVLGWGQGNFPYVFNKYYDPELHGAEPWFDRAHNVFLDWLISGGVPGLLAYLAIFFAVLYMLWKKKENDFSFLSKAMFTGFFAAYFFHNIFVFDNLVSYILFFTLLAYIQMRSEQGYDEVPAPEKKRETRVRTGEQYDLTVAAGSLVFVVAVAYMFNYHAYAQNKLLIQALRVQDPAQSLLVYEEALTHNSYGNGETRERLVFQAQQVYRTDGIDQNVKNAYASLAIDEMNKQIELIPGESKYPLFLSGLYSGMRDYNNAAKVLEAALEVAPKKELVLLSLGDAYVNAGNPEKALDMYKQAFENASTNYKAAVRYAYAALLVDNEPLANDILTPIYGTYLIPDPLIIGYYGRAEKYDVVEDIYLQAIEDNPTEPDHRFKLVGIYIQMNEPQKAIAVLETAMEELPIEQYPNVHNDAKIYIERIQNGEY